MHENKQRKTKKIQNEKDKQRKTKRERGNKLKRDEKISKTRKMSNPITNLVSASFVNGMPLLLSSSPAHVKSHAPHNFKPHF